MRTDPYGNQLLNRMHHKHGAYWYVYRNKWRNIGKTYNQALHEYSDLTAVGGSMVPLINQTFDAYEIRLKSGELKLNTVKGYRIVKNTLITAFQNLDPKDVTPSDIKQLLAHYYSKSNNMYNRALVVLRGIFELGTDTGVCDYNPASQVKRKKERKRKRMLTDAEFKNIRHCAKGQLPLIMDVLYYTGQRIGDVLAIKQADIKSGHIHFTQEKTGTEIDIEMGRALTSTVAKARGGRVTGMYLFSSKGKAMSYFTVRSAYQAACKLARVDDTTLHDIRSKAITDVKRLGGDAQKFAGHKDPKMTERYIRDNEPDKVKSLDSLRQ